MVRARLVVANIFLTAMLGPGFAAEPTNELLLSQAHDCLVQPFIVTELGSPANGLLEEVLVDRGARVTKGIGVSLSKKTKRLARTHENLRKLVWRESTARCQGVEGISTGRQSATDALVFRY